MLPSLCAAAAEPLAAPQAAELPAVKGLNRVAPIINPYLKTMGIQSQVRCGSGKACKRQATKLKVKMLHQSAMPGGTIFVPMRDCRVCKAERLKMQGNKINIPHRAHHPRCVRNAKTKGTSATTIMVNKEAERNMMINRAGMNTVLGQKLNSRMPSVQNFFCKLPSQEGVPTQQTALPEQTPLNTDSTISKKKGRKDDDSATKQSKVKADYSIPEGHHLNSAVTIRTNIDRLMKGYRDDNNDPEYAWIRNGNYPAALACAIGYVVSTFLHRKESETNAPLPNTPAFLEAIGNYRKFFAPGSCVFTYPPDFETKEPSPDYHSIVGESFIYVDWKLISSSVELFCPICFAAGMPKEDCWLLHARTGWSKRKSLFPIWTIKGRPTLAALMTYKCKVCNVVMMANDGRLLSILPAALRQIYPCDPRYCTGTFHLDSDLSDNLEQDMKTYANASVFGKRLLKKLGQQYSRKVENYLSLCPRSPFVSFEDFMEGISPPSAASIRKFFVDGFYSPLTPYGYSQYDRIVREMQNVKISGGDTIACDWTFQVAKNYNLKGAKAMFTANVGRTNEIFALAIVSSTAVSQVSHMLVKMMKKRRSFKPSVLYHDTCPNNAAFWKQIFGSHFEIRLGLFHLLHRIVDTLDSKSEWYWEGLVALKQTIYEYNQDDLERLLAAMTNGTFDRYGEKYSAAKIEDLRHSKRWKERCDPFLRKTIRKGGIIGQGIMEWVRRFKDKGVAEERRPLFTKNTEKVALEQISKVQWVEDLDGINMYRMIPAGKKSTHGLPRYLSNRPESGLEKFHEHLAHMANTGSGKELADALTLAGTGDHNCKARWKEVVNNRKINEEEIAGTVEYEDEPPFWDHSYLDLLNHQAELLGMHPIFQFVTPPSDDNGEVFLSKYFEEQQQRTSNDQAGQGICSCRDCHGYCPLIAPLATTQPLPQEATAAPVAPTHLQQLQAQPWQQPMVPIVPHPVAQVCHPTLSPPKVPFGRCQENPPFYCPPKLHYYNKQIHGHGGAGRPPSCSLSCVLIYNS
jgi:hypothetical protein